MRKYTKVLPLSVTIALALSAAGSLANDWGYEDGSSVTFQSDDGSSVPASRAQAKTAGPVGPAANKKPAASRPVTSAPSAAVKPSNSFPPLSSTQDIIRQNQAVDSWQKLYALVAPSEIAGDEQERLRQYLLGKLSGKESANYTSVLDYWPDVQKAMDSSLDQKGNYRDLFRALLRLKERSARTGDTQAVADADYIAEVLGPLRVAVPGNPPLTEDSINAYADMACFLFEQKHPGRTLDATDNRTLFAKMIVDKFKEAPTEKDKLAMINFDLSWAKFKILWTGADSQHRERLLQQWSGDATTGGASLRNQTLESILSRGPWTAALSQYNAMRAATSAGAQKQL